MAQFSQEQVDVGNTILSVGRSMGVTNFQLRAAFAAGYVESGLRNLNYGDRDSLGVFQQRPSQGWGTPEQIMNVSYAARKFFETAMRASQSGTVGQLAQRVQRSAFPSRYDAVLPVSDEILTRLGGGNLVQPIVINTPQLNALAGQQSAVGNSNQQGIFIVVLAGLGALLFFGNRYY